MQTRTPDATYPEASATREPGYRPEPLAVTVDAARAMLGGVSRSSIYRALDAGELQSTRVLGRRLILVESIHKALARGAGK